MDVHEILHRLQLEQQIKKQLKHIQQREKKTKIGFYISGPSGCGKSYFIKSILRSLHYNILEYSCIGIKHSLLLDNIEEQRFFPKNVNQFFQAKKTQNIAIIIDDIHYSYTQDKKYFLQIVDALKKKMKKSQLYIPFFFIGFIDVNKQLKAILQISEQYNMKRILEYQIKQLFSYYQISQYTDKDLKIINGNLHTFYSILTLKQKQFTYEPLLNTHHSKTKINSITSSILSNGIARDLYNESVEESTKTSIGLMYHENIADTLQVKNIPFYILMLNNYIYSDYIDRIIFQKQLWILNDVTCMIKVLETSLYYDDYNIHIKPKENIRFTQILTKYASEYNNFCFIRTISDILQLDKKDIVHYMIIHNQDTELPHIDLTVLQLERIKKLFHSIYTIKQKGKQYGFS